MPTTKREREKFSNRFVIVTGGSKGIGLAIARRVFSLGANVCIVARDVRGLASARAEIDRVRARDDQFLETVECDCCDQSALASQLGPMIEKRGTPDHLINSAGFARPAYFRDTDVDEYRRHLEGNYFVQLVPSLVVLPMMIRAGRGHVCNVASVLGFMGLLGYAAYCPGKFAIVGLTEALRNELGPDGITFSVAFPADVDTPGYAIENLTKPPECKEMSKRGKLMTAEAVADSIVKGIAAGRYEICPGEASFLRRMFRFFPGLVRSTIDADLRKARTSLGL